MYLYQITLWNAVTEKERYWYLNANSDVEAFQQASIVFNNDKKENPLYHVTWAERVNEIGGVAS